MQIFKCFYFIMVYVYRVLGRERRLLILVGKIIKNREENYSNYQKFLDYLRKLLYYFKIYFFKRDFM